MRYHALATDYDETLATHGTVDDETIAALERLRDSGRHLLLVTGRELESLQAVFPRLDLFERVVAENGALLYEPTSGAARPLAPLPPEAFARRLRQRGVEPLSVGRVIVATRTPHEVAVIETIRDLGLEHEVIFNKGAVMVLPPGVNKATGLEAALAELGLSPHNVAGVGDAENDHAFLRLCEAAVAVADALPSLKDEADLVTAGGQGAGVTELIERLIADDLAEIEPTLTRHHVLLGHLEDGGEFRLPGYGPNVLVAGPSSSGKSTLTTGLLERYAAHRYQYCLIDPEGDYENLETVIYLGGPNIPPDHHEVIEALRRPGESVAVSLLGLPLEDRPGFFQELLPRLQSLRSQLGRPHWIFVDEAHHMLPAGWQPAATALPQELHGLLMITISPEHMARAILENVDVLIVVGAHADETIRDFCRAVDEQPPRLPAISLPAGWVLVWERGSGRAPVKVRVKEGQTERRRHRRKYMEGRLIPEEQFRFRGPEDKLDLHAQNLATFMRMGEGVDDATWLYHLRRHDYSHWFRDVIKDPALAREAEQVEANEELSAEESRRSIRGAIEERYTLPE